MRNFNFDKNKYGVAEKQDRTYNGITFMSKKEMDRYKELLLLCHTGEIIGLKRQPKFVLQGSFEYNGKTERAINYIGDFLYINSKGEMIVEDVKGMKTPVYEIKRKMFLKIYGNDYIFREV